jgi:hypothetical protein
MRKTNFYAKINTNSALVLSPKRPYNNLLFILASTMVPSPNRSYNNLLSYILASTMVSFSQQTTQQSPLLHLGINKY